EPRRGNRFRCSRRTSVCHSGSSDQRHRRSYGRPVSVGRQLECAASFCSRDPRVVGSVRKKLPPQKGEVMERAMKSVVTWARPHRSSETSSRQKPLLIKKGHVVDPRNNVDAVMDVLIQGRHIEKVAREIKPPADAEVLDASSLIVAPGLIDIHVHLR